MSGFEIIPKSDGVFDHETVHFEIWVTYIVGLNMLAGVHLDGFIGS